MDTFCIGYGEIDDSKGIAQIEKNVFQDPWSEKAIRTEIEKGENSIYVVCREKTKGIVGYCGIKLIVEEGYITNIAVDEKYRGNKIGWQVLDVALNWAREKGAKFATLEVRSSNKIAIEMYIKMGFIEQGIRENYYSNGESVVMMRKDF